MLVMHERGWGVVEARTRVWRFFFSRRRGHTRFGCDWSSDVCSSDLILGVLTHIDLLSPAMEWQPPYDWQKGERPKEKNIRAAVEAAKEQLGGLVDVVVPVCTTEGKVFGIDEGLLPALAAELDEARVVAVL